MRRILSALAALLVVALPIAEARAETLACGTLDGLLEGGLGGTATANIDLDGTYKLITDGDGDTYFTSLSDDITDYFAGGVQRLRLSSSSFQLYGIDAYLNGGTLRLDVDDDTYIDAAVDDLIDFTTGGVQRMTLSGAVLAMQGSTSVHMNLAALRFDLDDDTYIASGTDDTLQFGLGNVVTADLSSGLLDVTGAFMMADSTTPTCESAHGCLWVESDGTLHFRHGTSGDETIAGSPDVKSYSLRTGTSGTRWLGGFYNAPAADVNFTDGSPTATRGTANGSAAAHAFIVAGGAGTCSGGCTSCTVVVSGTSIDDDGTRTPADSETVSADVTAESLDAYSETAKKWVGQATWTLTPDAGTCTLDANIGLAKYDDRGNRNHTIVGFEIVGEGGGNDSSFNATLFHHEAAGWSYHATAFAPGGTVVADQNTDHLTESEIINGEPFAYKRSNLSTAIAGASSEGYLIRIVTGSANTIDNMDAHVSVTF